MKLSKITSIASGVNVRKSNQPDGFALKASSFLAVNAIEENLEMNIKFTKNLDKHILLPGTVLVLSKGRQGFNAYFYDGKWEPAVASSAFLVLRDLVSSYSAKFIQWFINMDTTQKYLNSLGRGSALPAINKSILGELEIPDVSLSTQKSIVEIDTLKKQETQLIHKIDKLNSQITDKKLKNSLNQYSNE